MASGIGLSLDTSFLQSLETYDKKIKDLTDKTNALSRATVQAFQQMANSGVIPYVEQLNRQKKALEEIGKIKGSSPFLMQMQRDAKATVDEINNLIKTLERTKAYRGEASGRTAISFANSVLGQRGEAKSIDNMKLAISQLEAAQNRLNLNTKTGQKNYEKIQGVINKVKTELDKATGSNKNLTEESKKTADAMEKTGRRISTAFALNAISAFVRQLREIRGEFEIQHRSLQVLLQDTDKANELWEKTTALAVKSPYRVKELVTYTKQLAAYRIESEKLYDTNKMLADVAAGLGVDMNRLILAFGQVKAANFLRGTELRQFSEAGVNLLEELAKRFTELEGRAVSVGDVFERVSKRMVTFADVEAVFETITSEGGVFYQMQEKQSETIKGMWENIKDSVDLAFNEIGQSGDTELKTVLKLTKEIVDNWRKFIPIISGAGVTFLTYFSVTTLMGVGKAVTSLAGPWGLVAGAVLGVAAAIVTAIKATNELTAAMNRIDMEVSGQLQDSVSLYMKLTKAVNDVTSSEKERNKALDQLKAKFADILPDQMLELEYIQGIADNYSEATDAMMNYYTAKSREQKKDKVESHYAEEIEGTDIPELIAATRNAINKLGEKGLISQDMQLALLGSVRYAINAVTEQVKAGEVSADMYSMTSALYAELEKYSGYEGSLFSDFLQINTTGFREQIKDLSITLFNFRKDVENIPQFSFGSYAKDEAAKAFLPEKENIEKAKEVFKSMMTEFTLLSQQTVDTWKGSDEAIFDIISNLPPEMSAYAELLSEVFEKLKIAAQKGGFEFKAAIQGLQQDFTFNLPTALWSQSAEGMFGPMSEGIREELVQLVTNMQDTLSDEAKNLELTDFQNSVISVFRNVAKDIKGADLNVFKDFIPDLKKSRGEIIKELNALEAQYTDTVAAWDKSISEGISPMMAEHIHQISEEEIAQMRANIPALDEAAKRLGEIEKKTKKSDKTIEERIKVVDQMNKKYLELNKTLSKAESLQGAFDAYKDAFATAYGREDVRQMSAEDFAKNVLNFPDENSVIAWLDNLAKTVKDKEDKFKVQIAKGKFEMDVDVRLKKEADEKLEKDIQDMFDKYDMMLDLKKLDIPKDVAKNLFGVESIDLDDIRKKVQEELDKAKAVGGNEDRIKQLEKDLEKVNDMEEEAQAERLKKYVEYAKKGVSERAKIKLEELKKLKEIEETFAAKDGDTEEAKAQKASMAKGASDAVRKESQEALNRLDWEEFEKSDMFIRVFDDLDNASSSLLNHMIDKISEFKGEWKDMPLEDVEKIFDALNKLQTKLAEANPWEQAKKAKDDLEKAKKDVTFESDDASKLAKKGQGSYLAALDKEDVYQSERLANANEEIAMLEVALKIKQGQATEEERILAAEEKYHPLLKKDVDALNKDLTTQKGIKTAAEGQLKATAKVRSEHARVKTSLAAQYSTLSESFDMAVELGSAVKDLVGVLTKDDPAMVFAEMGLNMLTTVANTLALQAQLMAAQVAATGLGAAMNTAAGVIGWIVMAIQLLVTAISSAVNYAEKMRQMKLDVLAGQVDNLKQKFDALAESIDEAWSLKQLKEYEKELDKVQDKMKDAQEDYIKLLESNDKDKNTIETAKNAQSLLDDGLGVEELTNKQRKALLSEEYQNYKDATDALAEIEEDYADKKKEILENLGGITDPHDAASEFVDAWIDAYKETGDGLAGLEKNFDEFFENLIKQKAARMLSDTLLTKWIDTVNGALAEDSAGGRDLTESEMSDIKAAQEKAKGDINALLKGLFEGLDIGKDGGSLSALQKGIQGITEDTAQIIEAYLNSIRGYVSEHVTYTKRLYEMFDRMSHGTTYGLNVRMIS